MILLGRTSSNVGRYAGLLSGGPNYNVRFRRYRTSRRLYHSGLDDLIDYPQVPTETINFSLDMLARSDWVESKTLTSNLTQRWDAVYHDVIIKEVFSGDLSQQWSFMHQLYQHWTTLFGPGEYGLWWPLDRTDKIYRVQIVNMLIDGEEFKPEYVGRSQPDKWMPSRLEVWLKLLPAFPPSVTLFGSGAF